MKQTFNYIELHLIKKMKTADDLIKEYFKFNEDGFGECHKDCIIEALNEAYKSDLYFEKYQFETKLNQKLLKEIEDLKKEIAENFDNEECDFCYIANCAGSCQDDND